MHLTLNPDRKLESSGKTLLKMGSARGWGAGMLCFFQGPPPTPETLMHSQGEPPLHPLAACVHVYPVTWVLGRVRLAESPLRKEMGKLVSGQSQLDRWQSLIAHYDELVRCGELGKQASASQPPRRRIWLTGCILSLAGNLPRESAGLTHVPAASWSFVSRQSSVVGLSRSNLKFPPYYHLLRNKARAR